MTNRCILILICVSLSHATFAPSKLAAQGLTPTSDRNFTAQEYDQLDSQGLQYLANASFEAVLEDGSRATDWAIVPAAKDQLSLIVDASQIYHGQKCVRLISPKLQYIYGKISSVVSGKLRISAMLRGQGKTHFALLLYGDTPQQSQGL